MRCFTYYVVTGKTRQAVGVKWIRRDEHLDSWNAIVRVRDELIFREDICFPFQLCHLLQRSLFVSQEQRWYGTMCKCCYFSHSYFEVGCSSRLFSYHHIAELCCKLLLQRDRWQVDRSVENIDAQPAVRTAYVCISASLQVCASTNLYIIKFFYYPWSQAWFSIRTGDVQVLNHTKTHNFNNWISAANLNIPIQITRSKHTMILKQEAAGFWQPLGFSQETVSLQPLKFKTSHK